MLTLLSVTYLLAILASVVAALAGWTAHAARARFRSALRWGALSVGCAVTGAGLCGSWMFAMLLAKQGSLAIGIVLLPIAGTVLGAAIPLFAISKLRRIEPPPARGNSWPVFVIAGLSTGDQSAELTLDNGSMQIGGGGGSDQRFLIPLDEIARVLIDVTTVVIERASAGPAIEICPAIGDDAGPLALRTAALRLHRRLAAEIAARRGPRPRA